MKAIMTSIRPQHVANILNGLKTLEIRKSFPSDYVGWVYIYCTKDRNNMLTKNASRTGYVTVMECIYPKHHIPHYKLNGKVVARFWCDKVEEIICSYSHSAGNVYHYNKNGNMIGMQGDLLNKSCLDYKDIFYYLKGQNGYAIHITNLEIFDKPKEISEFWTSNYNKGAMCDNEPQFPCTKCPNTGALYCNCKFLLNGNCSCISLTRAPQSWCYIEI